MNSRMAWSYERFELEDVRRFKTTDFDCSRSGNLRTVFGTRLRLLFAIGSGLRCRGEKHDPFPDLLASTRLSGLILVFFGRFWVLQTTSEVFTRISPDNSLERLTECGVGLVTDQSSDFGELFVTPFK